MGQSGYLGQRCFLRMSSDVVDRLAISLRLRLSGLKVTGGMSLDTIMAHPIGGDPASTGLLLVVLPVHR